MNIIEEKKITDFPRAISIDEIKKALEQIKNDGICIIHGNKKGNGFFIKIPYLNGKKLPVLITCNHVLNKKYLDSTKKLTITLGKNKTIELDLQNKNRIIYTNEKYDITIIEIKKNKDNIKYFLELDDNHKFCNVFLNETIYILQNYELKYKSISFGILNNIENKDDYIFNHFSDTIGGSSGSPIFNLSSNKVIGMHIGCSMEFNFNKGIFLNEALKAFIESVKKNNINPINFKEADDENKNLILNRNDSILDRNQFWNNRTILDEKASSQNIANITLKESLQDESEKEILNLSNFNIIKTLHNDKFENIKELYLSKNNILNINDLKEIKLDNLEILDLSNNKINNLSAFRDIKLHKLKKLFFQYNKLVNINDLIYLELEKLEILDLANNKIKDINIFEKKYTYKMKELYISSNEITNISFLNDICLNELEILDIGDNKIENIDDIGNFKMKNLKLFSLHRNKVSDINILKNVNFDKLELLAFSFNNINNLNILKNSKLNNLKELWIANNKIEDIKFLENCNLTNLELLTFNSNYIKDISPLAKFKCKTLKKLYFIDNTIDDINILRNVKFDKIEELYFSDNKITDISVLKDVNFPNLTEIQLAKNNISNIDVLKDAKFKYKFKNLIKINLKFNKIDEESIEIKKLKDEFKKTSDKNNTPCFLMI